MSLASGRACYADHPDIIGFVRECKEAPTTTPLLDADYVSALYNAYWHIAGGDKMPSGLFDKLFDQYSAYAVSSRGTYPSMTIDSPLHNPRVTAYSGSRSPSSSPPQKRLPANYNSTAHNVPKEKKLLIAPPMLPPQDLFVGHKVDLTKKRSVLETTSYAPSPRRSSTLSNSPFPQPSTLRSTSSVFAKISCSQQSRHADCSLQSAKSPGHQFAENYTPIHDLGTCLSRSMNSLDSELTS